MKLCFLSKISLCLFICIQSPFIVENESSRLAFGSQFQMPLFTAPISSFQPTKNLLEKWESQRGNVQHEIPEITQQNLSLKFILPLLNSSLCLLHAKDASSSDSILDSRLQCCPSTHANFHSASEMDTKTHPNGVVTDTTNAEEKVGILVQDRKVLKQELLDLRDLLIKQAKSLTCFKATLDTATRAKEKYKEETCRLREVNTQLRLERTALEDRVSISEGESERLQSAVRRQVEALQELGRQMQALTESRNALQAQLAEEVQARERAVRSVELSAAAQVSVLQSELATMRTEVDRLLSEVERSQRERDAVDEQAQRREANLRAALTAAEAQKEHLTDDLTQANATAQVQARAAQELREELTERAGELEKVRSHNVELERKISQLQASFAALEQAEHQAAIPLQAALDAERAQLSPNLSEEKVQWEAEMQAQREKIVEKEEQHSKLQQKIQALEGDNARLVLERCTLDQERRQLLCTIQELRGNIRVLCRVRPLKNEESCQGAPVLRLLGPTTPVGYGIEIGAPGCSQAASVIPGFANPTRLLNRRGGRLLSAYQRVEDREAWRFSFDQVLGHECSQEQVFQEVSALIKSVLEGYRVCIFAYGQTGSGKTYTMEGPGASNDPIGDDTVPPTLPSPGDPPKDSIADPENGMQRAGPSSEEARQHMSAEGSQKPVCDPEQGLIPRAVELLFREARAFQATGWTYSIQVSFLEIYQETLRDLLDNRFDAIDFTYWFTMTLENEQRRYGFEKRMEIRVDPATGLTTVTDLITMEVLDSKVVESLLRRASRARATAATECNERSSRSHSIFTLRVRGVCDEGKQTTEGILNLVDLAGSERLSSSGASGARLKETLSINRSLSCLGDVITALANKDPHIPYRNSKLTHLLQPCLGGNAKTLMLVNLSPAAAHFQETLCTLRFASKLPDRRL